MKVSELIEELKKHDGDLLVVMSQDPEGNGFGPLVDVESNSVFIPKWQEIQLRALTPEMREAGYTEEDVYGYPEDPDYDTAPDGHHCIVLWP